VEKKESIEFFLISQDTLAGLVRIFPWLSINAFNHKSVVTGGFINAKINKT
jgi:hypothetical protein